MPIMNKGRGASEKEKPGTGPNIDYSDDSDYSGSGSSCRSDSHSDSSSYSASGSGSSSDSSRSSSDDDSSDRSERGNAKPVAEKGAGKAKNGKNHYKHGKGGKYGKYGKYGKTHKNAMKGTALHRDGPVGGPIYAAMSEAGVLSGKVGKTIEDAFEGTADFFVPPGHKYDKNGSGRVKTTTQMGKGRSHANRSAPTLTAAPTAVSPAPVLSSAETFTPGGASASEAGRPFQLGRMVHYDTKNGAAHFKVPITFRTTGRPRDFDANTARMEFTVPNEVIEHALDTHLKVHASELGGGIFQHETKDRILPYAIDVQHMSAEHIDEHGRTVAPLAHDVGLSFEPSEYPAMSLLNQQQHSAVPGRAFVGHTGLHFGHTGTRAHNSIEPRLTDTATRMDAFDAQHELGAAKVVGQRIKGDSYLDLKKNSKFYKTLENTEPYRNWVAQQKGEGKHRETADHVHDVLSSDADKWAAHIQTEFNKEYLRHNIFGGMKFKLHPIPTHEQASATAGINARDWADETEASHTEPMRVSVSGFAHFALPLQRPL